MVNRGFGIKNPAYSIPVPFGGVLKEAIDAQRAAGIMVVVAAGNHGPACSSVLLGTQGVPMRGGLEYQ